MFTGKEDSMVTANKWQPVALHHNIFFQRPLQNGITHGISTIYAFFSTIIHNCLFKCNASLEEQPRRDFTRHTKMFTGKEDTMVMPNRC